MELENPRSSLVLLLETDAAVCDGLSTLLGDYGLEVHAFPTAAEFWKAGPPGDALCIICEADLPDSHGIELHGELRRRGVLLPFALMVSSNARKTLVLAVRSGVAHIIRKPLIHHQLLRFVERAAARSAAPLSAGITDGR